MIKTRKLAQQTMKNEKIPQKEHPKNFSLINYSPFRYICAILLKKYHSPR